MAITINPELIHSALVSSALAFINPKINVAHFDPKAEAEVFYEAVEKDSKNGVVDNGEIIFGFPLIWKDDVFFNNQPLTENNGYVYDNLNAFFKALKQKATVHYVENGEGFTRQAAPPKEAYEYKGHNKLDIKPSNIASALLYED
jgi:hypothetical protein